MRENFPGEGHLSNPGGEWLPGAYVNAANNCLSLNSKRSLDDIMILWRDEGKDDLPLNKMKLEEFRSEVWYANSFLIFMFMGVVSLPIHLKSVS